ncbi:MAG: PTS system mannose/fructose/sorbose family transporter subunit IID [Collinsella sp.]|nr:PTS system mannose/fructose/sorbose family transporter subunit IID [Collinsella sp.]
MSKVEKTLGRMTDGLAAPSTVFTKSELRRLSWRWAVMGQLCLNYSKMQGSGYLSTMVPALKRLYGNDPEALRRATKAHSQFYNCTPHMTHMVLGMDLAIEESEGIDAIDSVAALKTSLMGPLSGIGDTIFAVMNSVVFGSIAATMAVEGSYVGVVIWEIWYLFVLFVLRPLFFKIGYQSGSKVISEHSDQFKLAAQAVSILGLIVVGSMLASMVNLNLGTVMLFGQPLELGAGFFDKIMPKLPQALLACGAFWLAGREKMTTTKLIMIVIVFCIAMSAAGILV